MVILLHGAVPQQPDNVHPNYTCACFAGAGLQETDGMHDSLNNALVDSVLTT